MQKLNTSIIVAVAIAAAQFPFTASAQIQDPVVTSGAANFNSDGRNTIIHATNNTIINYSRFDVPVDHSVQFVQPAVDATVFNRINSPSPSIINGPVDANGIVYFLNPSGVIFGNGAVINAAQFFAIGSHLSNTQLLTNPLEFNNLTGVIENHGSITAQAVHLIGSRVINRGIILADNVVTLAAGSRVMLSETDSYIAVVVEGVDSAPAQPGIENSGTINAPNGRITLAAGDMLSVAMLTGSRMEAKEIVIRSGSEIITEGDNLLAAENIDLVAPAGVSGSIHAIDLSVDTTPNITINGSVDSAVSFEQTGGGSLTVGGDTGGLTVGGDIVVTGTTAVNRSNQNDDDSTPISSDTIAANSESTSNLPSQSSGLIGNSRNLANVATQPVLSTQAMANMVWRRLGVQDPARYTDPEANQLIADLYYQPESDEPASDTTQVAAALMTDPDHASALELLRDIRSVIEDVRPITHTPEQTARDIQTAIGSLTPRGVTTNDLLALIGQVEL